MGFILDSLLRVASKVAVKATTVAAKKAGNGVIKVAAKRAAVKAGTRVASGAIKAGVLHAQITAPIYAYRLGSKVPQSNKQADPKPKKSNNSAPKQNVTVQRTVDARTEQESARLANATKKYLIKYGVEKIKLFDLIKKYCASLEKVVELPENIEFDRNYSISILSTTDFKSLVETFDEIGLDKTRHSVSVALFGFKEEAIEENDNIDLSGMYINEEVPSNIREMRVLYNKIASHLQNLIKKTAICFQRYNEYLASLRRVFGRPKKYLAIKKYVDSSYIRTFSILDYINFDLFTDSGLNEEKINAELRRKII